MAVPGDENIRVYQDGQYAYDVVYLCEEGKGGGDGGGGMEEQVLFEGGEDGGGGGGGGGRFIQS